LRLLVLLQRREQGLCLGSSRRLRDVSSSLCLLLVLPLRQGRSCSQRLCWHTCSCLVLLQSLLLLLLVLWWQMLALLSCTARDSQSSHSRWCS
jgi:hypothetical protein